ncbi:Uncharacterised protein [uncultured archaeon]|nr:Uncharacterised protein [uncultured archaeon]
MSKKLLLLFLIGFCVTAATLDTTIPTVVPSVTPAVQTNNIVQNPVYQDSNCRIESDIALSDLEQLWNFDTGFQAKQLNNLNDAKAASLVKNPSSLTQPLVINNYMSAEPQSVPISKLAQLLNQKPEDIAGRFGRPVNGFLTKGEAELLAATPEQKTGIDGLFSNSNTPPVVPNPVDQYMVMLRNGTLVSLSAFENFVPLNSDACLLNQYMQAEVSYIGLTDKNYFLGHTQNTQVKQESHISSSTTNALLYLGKDGKNMIVPEFYRQNMVFFSTWDTISFLAGWELAARGSSNAADATKAMEAQEKKKLAVTEANTELNSFEVTINNAVTNRQNFETQLAAAQAAGAPPAQLAALQANIDHETSVITSTQTKSAATIPFTQQNTRTQLNQLETDQAKAKSIAKEQKKLGVRAATRGIILGFAFLGPARYLYSINDGLIFTSNSFNENDAASLKSNYIKVYAQNAVLTDYREATNQVLFGLGGLEELAAGVTGLGVPADAFSTGPMFILNAPTASNTVGASYSSFIKGPNNHWVVNTGWKGSSDFQTFEKITPFNDFARVAVESNSLPPNVLLKRQQLSQTEATVLALAVPFLFTRQIPQLSGTLVNLLPFLLSTNLVLAGGIDNYKVGQFKCNSEDIQGIKDLYLTSVIADSVLNNFLPAWKATYIKSLASKSSVGLTSKIGKNVMNFFSSTSPFQNLAWYLSNQIVQYASTCYDSQYTVTAWQDLKKVPDASSTSKLNDALKPLQGILNKTPVGSLFNGLGDPVASRDELINLKASFDDQQSNLELKDLYYLHIDSGTTQWHGLLSQNKGCFQRLDDNNKDAKISPETGIQLKVNDTVVANFNSDDWKKRAAFAMDNYDFGRTIIPNKLISFRFSCPDPFLIDSKGHIQANPSCPEVACLFNMLSSMTGVTSNDLTDYLGTTDAIYTSQGMATFGGSNIRFDYSVYMNRSDVVKEPASPTVLHTYDTGKGIIREVADPLVNGLSHYTTSGVQYLVDSGRAAIASASSTDAINQPRDSQQIITELSSPGVDVAGRDYTGSLIVGPQAYLNGYINDADKKDSVNVGDFQTLISKNARMEYDSTTGRVYLAFYVLGSALPGSIKGIEVSNSINQDANGKPVNSIKIDRVNAVTGANEADVAKLNSALQKVQQNGSFQMFETDKYIYYFTTDDKGNNIMRICEKATGICKDVQITGITKDGNNINVQTPQGTYKFNFGTDQNGNPTVQVDGPNGFQDISKLLSARAPGGILLFDPNSGWQLLNAQDIPWDKKLQQNGVSFFGNADGTAQGVPSNNLLGNQPVQGSDVAANVLANLPSVPENFYGMLVFASLLIGSVIVIRFREV